MKYDPYSLTELIRNDSFIAWVRHPDEVTEAFWQQFLTEFPEKRAVIEEARAYVNLLTEHTGRDKPTGVQSKKMWLEIKKHLRAKTKQEPNLFGIQWRWMRIAASMAIMLGIAAYGFLNHGLPDPQLKIVAQQVLEPSERSIEKHNTGPNPMTVLLEDGSSVVLQSGALLTYSEVKSLDKREVNLIGKAFFEIHKDSKRPFYVYTDGLVTKVLGTSFSIDAPRDSDKIKVEVKTGKVSVFAIGKDASHSKMDLMEKSELGAIVLERDQKMAIYRQTGKPVFNRKAENEPAMAADISTQLFMFDETPASEVFAALESAYHIKIIYNKALLESCPLNATLIGQPFSEKLSAICVALDAQYEIKDNQVFITGNGCK